MSPWRSSRISLVVAALATATAGLWLLVANLSGDEGYGGLYFSSVPPGATLFVDGDSVGVTPLVLDSVPAGTRVIRLSHPFYDDLVASVTVRESLFTRVPHVTMRRAVGTLTIRSEPSDASIWFDDRNMGVTPRTMHNVPYGRYPLLLVHYGYAEQQCSVMVSAPRTVLTFPMRQGVFFAGRWVSPEVRDSLAREQEVGQLRSELERAVEERQWARAEELAGRLRALGSVADGDTLPSLGLMRVEDLADRVQEAIRGGDWAMARDLNRRLFLLDVRRAAALAPGIQRGLSEQTARDRERSQEDLEHLIDEAVAAGQFERASSLLTSLGELDAEEARRRTAQVDQARLDYIQRLEHDARARWFERDRIALNRVLSELMRVDPTNPAHESYRHMPGQVVHMRTMHTGDVWSVAITPDGEYIVSGSYDDTVKLWRLSDGSLVRTMSGHRGDVQAVAVTPDGQYVVSAGDDKTIRVWRLSTGECIRVLQGHTDLIWSVIVSHDGSYIVSGSYDGTVRMWDMARVLAARPGDLNAANNSMVRMMREDNEIFSVAITPDGRYVLAANGDDFDRRTGNAIRIWDAESGELVRMMTGHTNDVTCIALTPDGTRVASSSLDGTVRLWRIEDGETLWTFAGHDEAVYSVVVTPDGQRVITGGGDNHVRVLNIADGAETRILRGHHGNVYALAVSPNGQYIVSGSRDKTLKVWRAPW